MRLIAMTNADICFEQSRPLLDAKRHRNSFFLLKRIKSERIFWILSRFDRLLYHMKIGNRSLRNTQHSMQTFRVDMHDSEVER